MLLEFVLGCNLWVKFYGESVTVTDDVISNSQSLMVNIGNVLVCKDRQPKY